MSVSGISQRSVDPYTLSYEDLTYKKLYYIERLEFEKAREIEKIIQEKRRSEKVVTLEAAKSSIEAKIREIYDIYVSNCDLIHENADEASLQIRENADSTFRDLQARHIDELTRLEKEYALEVIRAHKKIVPEQIEQQRRAKELAKANDFEGAVHLRTVAQQCFEREHAIRRQEIERKYAVYKKQIFERQKSDILILNTKLNDSLIRHQQTVEKDLRSQDRLFVVSILAEKQRTLVKMTSQVKNPENKRSMADELDRFVASKTEEITGMSLSSLGPPSPTRTPRQNQSQTITRNDESGTNTPRREVGKENNDEILAEEEENNNEYSEITENSDDQVSLEIPEQIQNEKPIEKQNQSENDKENINGENENQNKNEEKYLNEEEELKIEDYLNDVENSLLKEILEDT